VTGPLPRSARPFDRGVLADVDDWGAGRSGVAVLDRDGLVAERGSRDVPMPWASVTKLVSGLAILVAVDRGTVSLDDPAGPPGSTLRHLLAHASGLAFDDETVISPPARTRIYSNTGFDEAAAFVERATGTPFGELVRDSVLAPLGMIGASLQGRPSEGLVGTLRDIEALAFELLVPRALPASVVALASTVAFLGLRGVLPGFGVQDPLDWGLGFEIRGTKSPHWAGSRTSPATFGHFGGSGTFLWVDPEAGLAVATVTDRTFGAWAVTAWPAFSDRVVQAAGVA
jgi:CubicO group peptidase (beta-lactamase class C family)